jgi:TolB protein
LNQTVGGNSDIYLYDTQAKRFTRLTNDWGIDVSPSISPDGSQIVFTSDRGGSPQLYIMPAQSNGEARRLTFSGRYNTAPAWSPRGGSIAYVGTDTDGSLAVYTIGVDGQQLRRLASGGRNYESPTWAPNGRFMMYTSKHGDVWQRYMMREDGQAKLIPSGTGPSCFVSQWLQRSGPQ